MPAHATDHLIWLASDTPDGQCCARALHALYEQRGYHSEVRTLRGLHFQEPHSQGKLIQVLEGKIYDVAVDIRRSSPRFGKVSCCRESSRFDHREQLSILLGVI